MSEWDGLERMLECQEARERGPDESSSAWDYLGMLNEAMPAGYWNTGGSDDMMVLNDREAEAIEDASGRMGVEPPSRNAARKAVRDPAERARIYQAIAGDPEKYAAALGGRPALQLLMKKLGRGMSAKQMQPGAKPIGKVDLKKVQAQDVAGMRGSSQMRTTVRDPAAQEREPGMEDPTQWDLESVQEGSAWGKAAKAALAAGALAMGGGAMAQDPTVAHGNTKEPIVTPMSQPRHQLPELQPQDFARLKRHRSAAEPEPGYDPNDPMGGLRPEKRPMAPEEPPNLPWMRK